MSYLKFSADNIFTGIEMLNADKVIITTDTGTIGEIIDKENAGGNIQRFEGILCPGFINCHCHLELSYLKNLIPQNEGLINFVFNVVNKRDFDEEKILSAIEIAESEMIRNGIVAAGDICNTDYTFTQKQKNNLAYYNFIEVSGWHPSVAKKRFQHALKIYHTIQQNQINKQQTSNIQHPTSLVPHAPYSVSEELWQLIIPYFKNKTVTIHNQETAFEDEFFLRGTGDFNRMYEMMKIENTFFKSTNKTSLQTYFSKLSPAKNIILVHNTFTTEPDIDFAEAQAKQNNQNLFWCLCPNANKYIENALPPVELLRRKNCKIVFGTDSLASNSSLSILNEITTIFKNFPKIPFAEMLQWATGNAAQALQMQNQLGAFEKGKTPGINIIRELVNDHISKNTTVEKIL